MLSEVRFVVGYQDDDGENKSVTITTWPVDMPVPDKGEYIALPAEDDTMHICEVKKVMYHPLSDPPTVHIACLTADRIPHKD